MVAGGRVRTEAWEAGKRGVLFDVGHGAGSFSWNIARSALEQGFLSDTISTDLHVSSLTRGAISLPLVMSKFLHLGLSVTDVIRLATSAPARTLGLEGEVGGLRVGAVADVTVLRLGEGEFPLTDTEGVTEVVRRRLVPVHTLRRGTHL